MQEPESTEKPSLRAAVVRLFTRAYFLQRAMLILLAALLSGVLVPQIADRINETRDSKLTLARAQAKFFDEVSEVILIYQTLLLDVSYFGFGDAKSLTDQRRAYERYNDAVPMLVARYRVQISRARLLSSEKIAEQLEKFLDEIVATQDTPTIVLYSTCTEKCDWNNQHKRNMEMLAKAKVLISSLGADLGVGVIQR